MNQRTAQILNQTTSEFYAQQAQSFSATRQAPWAGWQRVAQAITQNEDLPRSDQAVFCSLLDIACGNMRFERYLQQTYPDVRFSFYGLDSCPDLMSAGSDVRMALNRYDIVGALIRNEDLAKVFWRAEQGQAVDAAVSFGFMHHIPGARARQRFLQQLCAAPRSKGVVAVSLWRFMESPDLAAKAKAAHEEALHYFAQKGVQLDLEENDYLLGWQHASQTFRYCHHFDAREVDELVEGVSGRASLMQRFYADGRTGNLNEYLIFRVR